MKHTQTIDVEYHCVYSARSHTSSVFVHVLIADYMQATHHSGPDKLGCVFLARPAARSNCVRVERRVCKGPA